MGTQSHHFMAFCCKGKCGSSDRFPLLGLQNHFRWWLQPENLKKIASWLESYDKPRQCVIKQRDHFADKGAYSQGYGLSSHLRLRLLDYKEGRMPKNWYFRTVVLEKTLESPPESKEMKTINLNRNRPWILTGRTDAEAEAPILRPPGVKSQLLGKDPDAGKDWR